MPNAFLNLSILALECCFLLYKVNQLYLYTYSPPSNTLVLTLSNKYETETLICFMSIFWSDTKTLSRLFASKCTFVCFNFICKNLCVKASHLSVSVSSVAQSCLTLCDWTVAGQASLSITNFRSLLKLISVKSVMPSNHLILCRPLLLLPSISPSIRVFSNESVLCIRWPNTWVQFLDSPPAESFLLVF